MGKELSNYLKQQEEATRKAAGFYSELDSYYKESESLIKQIRTKIYAWREIRKKLIITVIVFAVIIFVLSFLRYKFFV